MKDLNFYRLNILFAGILIPSSWIIHFFIFPNSNNPFIFNLFFFLSALAIIGFSYVSDYVASNIKIPFFVYIYIIVLWLGYLVYFNNAEPVYVMSQFIWLVVLSSYFESGKSLTMFIVFALVDSYLSVIFLNNPAINIVFYYLMLPAGLMVNYISLNGKVRAQKLLEDKTTELDKFKLIVQNAGEHIIITDSRGIIIFANDAVEKITGYSNAEVIGQRPSLWGGQMPKEFYDQMWDTIKNKKQRFTGEIHNKRKNGELYIAEADIAPILDSNGEVEFFVGIERDVTKVRMSQKDINEKVKELNRMNNLMVGRELKMVELKKQIQKTKGDKKL